MHSSIQIHTFKYNDRYSIFLYLLENHLDSILEQLYFYASTFSAVS